MSYKTAWYLLKEYEEELYSDSFYPRFERGMEIAYSIIEREIRKLEKERKHNSDIFDIVAGVFPALVSTQARYRVVKFMLEEIRTITDDNLRVIMLKVLLHYIYGEEHPGSHVELKDRYAKDNGHYPYILFSTRVFLGYIGLILNKFPEIKTFADIGCGVGHKLVSALAFPQIQESIGIEYTKETAYAGIYTLKRAQLHGRIEDNHYTKFVAHIENGDAITWKGIEQADLVYYFVPTKWDTHGLYIGTFNNAKIGTIFMEVSSRQENMEKFLYNYYDGRTAPTLSGSSVQVWTKNKQEKPEFITREVLG